MSALAAVVAFISLTRSTIWESRAYTLIGGTIAGMILILIFLPARYAIWYRIRVEEPNKAVGMFCILHSDGTELRRCDARSAASARGEPSKHNLQEREIRCRCQHLAGTHRQNYLVGLHVQGE